MFYGHKRSRKETCETMQVINFVFGLLDANFTALLVQNHNNQPIQIEQMSLHAAGQLQIISKICADEGANVLEVEHSRFAMDLSASVAKLNITIETQNSEHLKKIIQIIGRYKILYIWVKGNRKNKKKKTWKDYYTYVQEVLTHLIQ